ncbi:alpha/beta fold hydrolase [Empedobacter falsenii]|uniref:Alpha/beta fold hydrolase n=1 Tax=Empedobacter falsenii TaxID=343874 RepID=A0A427BNW4_9FLAO|nr:alpha/beta fold hydrolase [Empedobacter falsenii]RRT91561.1 alpha/beta fold hydrolase [Empedobacter falsenii]RRT91627.1 alpha/beta fold hydrolase [Empedobacter falsenii]
MSILENIYYRVILPEDEIKATLIIVHGMQEHSGRYENFAKYLTDKGILVLLYDHLGHGKTAKIEEDYSFFSLDSPTEKLIENTKIMVKWLEDQYPLLPHFILGHSMGSFITRCLLQEYGNHFDGAIIMGTGGRIPGIKLLSSFLSLLNKLIPHKRSKLLNTIFSKSNNKHFQNEENFHETNWLSLDELNRLNFLKDPLCGIPFTVNGFYTLINLNIQATKKNWAKAIPQSLPIYFVSGADDPIGDFGKGVLQSYKDLKQNGFQHVTMKLYPNLRHEILNESIKDEVYQDIVDWLMVLINHKKIEQKDV